MRESLAHPLVRRICNIEQKRGIAFRCQRDVCVAPGANDSHHIEVNGGSEHRAFVVVGVIAAELCAARRRIIVQLIRSAPMCRG